MVDQTTLKDVERALRNARWKILDFDLKQLEDTQRLLEDAVMAFQLEAFSRQKEGAYAIERN